jgi:hypothetical protein
LTFRETLPLFWRNFNTVASEPEGGVEVGDGHFIPDDTTPPLLWAQAEQLTQCWAEMRGLGVAVVTVISNVFPGMQNEAHMAIVHMQNL